MSNLNIDHKISKEHNHYTKELSFTENQDAKNKNSEDLIEKINNQIEFLTKRFEVTKNLHINEENKINNDIISIFSNKDIFKFIQEEK